LVKELMLGEALSALRDASASFKTSDGKRKWATFCKENRDAFCAAIAGTGTGTSQKLPVPDAVAKAVRHQEPTEEMWTSAGAALCTSWSPFAAAVKRKAKRKTPHDETSWNAMHVQGAVDTPSWDEKEMEILAKLYARCTHPSNPSRFLNPDAPQPELHEAA
jgi:hypothetical protein